MKAMTPETIIKAVAILVVVALFALALALTELYTQLARYRTYWNRNNATANMSADYIYVAFGDSAAQGVGATKPQNGYVGVIAKELEKKGHSVQVINLSKSGAKVKDVLDTQLPGYKKLNLESKPIVTVEIGANDMIDFDPVRFQEEMHALMKELPEGTVISDIPSFKGGRLSRLEPNVLKANEIMRNHTGQHGLQLANLHQRVAAEHSIRTLAADLFHPSDYGYRKNWAPAFLEKIKVVE